MLFILMDLLFIAAAWRWGDWRHWPKYHSTILYFLFGDVCYLVIAGHHPLWQHQPWPPFHSYMGAEICCLITFACTTLIYLGLFPKGIDKALAWMGCWVAILVVFKVPVR